MAASCSNCKWRNVRRPRHAVLSALIVAGTSQALSFQLLSWNACRNPSTWHSLRRSQSSIQLRSLAQKSLVFDGLDDLEEEEEPEPTQDYFMLRKPLGAGLSWLAELYSKYQKTGDDPVLDEEELGILHASLKQDLPKCPSLSTVAWSAKVLEEMELEDDDVFETISDIVKNRSTELEPQDTLNIALSFGELLLDEEALVDALAPVIRQQIKYFTTVEVVKLALGMEKLGALATSKHVGLFFEMRQRTNLPALESRIKQLLLVDPNAIQSDKDTQLQLEQVKLPPGSRLKKQVASGELAKRSSIEKAMSARKKQMQASAAQLVDADPDSHHPKALGLLPDK